MRVFKAMTVLWKEHNPICDFESSLRILTVWENRLEWSKRYAGKPGGGF